MKTLILVDLQNDFMPGGALAVPEGNEVVRVANKIMPEFDFVVATQDWHPANHGSFASQHEGVEIGQTFALDGIDQVAWPDHCLQNTVGAQLEATLNNEPIDAIVQKGTEPNIDSYSGFFDNGKRKSTGLEKLLRDKNVTEVTIMGLATDYCVKFTALDAVELGFKTNLILEGCRGVNLNENDISDAIAEMKRVGVALV